MANLKVLKLVTGEEIMGVVHDGRSMPNLHDEYSTQNLLFVTGPLKITSTYQPDTRTHSMYLSDWIPAISSEYFPIEKTKVITIGDASSQLEERYFEIITLSQYEAEDAEVLDKLKKHSFDDDDMQ